MQESPMISVIIPVYNTEEHLPQCFDSVINQTYKNIEIIVVVAFLLFFRNNSF